MEQSEQYVIADHSFGIEENFAYIKREKIGPDWVWSIYAATDGERIGFAKDLQTAYLLVDKNDLNPMCVH